MCLPFLCPLSLRNNALYKDARALFEASCKSFAPNVARPIWDCWCEYEFQYGDLQASLELDRRMAETYPSDSPLKRFAMRLRQSGVDPIANRDIGFAVARKDLGKQTENH